MPIRQNRNVVRLNSGKNNNTSRGKKAENARWRIYKQAEVTGNSGRQLKVEAHSINDPRNIRRPINHANSDESTGTLRGIFTGSSVTRNGLKVRL